MSRGEQPPRHPARMTRTRRQDPRIQRSHAECSGRIGSRPALLSPVRRAVPARRGRPLDAVADAAESEGGVAARAVVVELARTGVTGVDGTRGHIDDDDQLEPTDPAALEIRSSSQLVPITWGLIRAAELLAADRDCAFLSAGRRRPLRPRPGRRGVNGHRRRRRSARHRCVRCICWRRRSQR